MQRQAEMRVFKNKWFAKFARKENISDKSLVQAAREIEVGKIDADYGGGLIKQRIARTNEGKSDGYRSILLYKRGNKAIFVYGFAKSERDNIDDIEVREYKELAKIVFAFTDEEIAKLIKDGVWQELKTDDK